MTMSSGVCPWLQGQAWGRRLSKSLIFLLYTTFAIHFSQGGAHTQHRNKHRTSLVAQWLRICLPMQGTPVQSLDREDFTCCASTDLSTTTTGTHTPQSPSSAEGAAPARCNESPHEAMNTSAAKKKGGIVHVTQLWHERQPPGLQAPTASLSVPAWFSANTKCIKKYSKGILWQSSG